MKLRKSRQIFKDIRLYSGILLVGISVFNLRVMDTSFFSILFGFVCFAVTGIISIYQALFSK